MRFSIRFLILLVALCGIGLGIYERERRMNTPRVIPVRDRTSSQDSALVTVVAYHNPRKAKANHKNSEEEHLTTPAARRRLALKLATDVTKLNIWDHYVPAKWQVDGDERFVVFDLPRQWPTTAYLDKPVVEALSQRFGIVPIKAFLSKSP